MLNPIGAGVVSHRSPSSYSLGPVLAVRAAAQEAPRLSELVAYQKLINKAYWPALLRDDQVRIGGELYALELVPLAWGVMALGCTPKSAGSSSPPILVFPGTAPSVENGLKGATILADLDPLGPGCSIARQSTETVRAWLESAGGHAVLIGHSLGGALATQAAVHCSHHVQRVVTFNSPMIPRSIAQKWREIALEDRPAVYNYFRKGDLVARLGQEDLGESFAVDGSGKHNEPIFSASSDLSQIVPAKRRTSRWICVALEFVLLSIAFLLLGAVLLLVSLFLWPRGLNLDPQVPIFNRATQPHSARQALISA